MFRDFFRHILSFTEDFFKKEDVWLVVILLVLAGWGLLLILPGTLGLRQAFFHFISVTWWFWFFVIVFPIFNGLWLFWRQELYKNSDELRFILLELKIPREILRSPKAMEQVLMGIHSLRNTANDVQEKYWDGEITRWYALEMVSFGGEVHFYLRAYYKQRNLLEAIFFAHYPDIEIVEVEDYAGNLPKNIQELHAQNLDVWGSEMILDREEAYPIKTYPAFEAAVEEKELDPVSNFIEVLGKIKKEEFVGMQILIAPTSHDWKEKWHGLVEELKEASRRKVEGVEGIIREIVRTRTPGETDVLKAVESNLAKPAFDTLIRFIYLSPKETFYESFARRGLVGAFNQYAALDLNYFRQNYSVSTRTRIWNKPYVFPKTRGEYRKQRILRDFRKREIPPETRMGRFMMSYLFNWYSATRRFVMNTECLATLFHLPQALVLTAPHIPRVESKKAGPPAGLAIFGGEAEIEKYK